MNVPVPQPKTLGVWYNPFSWFDNEADESAYEIDPWLLDPSAAFDDNYGYDSTIQTAGASETVTDALPSLAIPIFLGLALFAIYKIETAKK